MNNNSEKSRQEKFPFQRTKYFPTYNELVGYFEAQSCIENSRGTSALDLPCGEGMLTEIFARHFNRVVGVDASSTQISSARKRCPSVTFYETLIENFQTDERFDTIFMLNILEHVEDPVAILRIAAKFLKPRGRLYVQVPNAEAVNRQIAVLMGTLTELGELSPYDIDVLGHRRSYTTDSLLTDIRRAGLKVIKSGGVFYKMLSSAQIDWLLQKGPWKAGGFGWGRVGAEKDKDWRFEFCRACYEYGKSHPRDCNLIYTVATR